MTRGFSLWLDLIRALAALMVLLGHMAHPRFTRGDYIIIRDWNLAPDAVMFFFVVSGLVIAYAAGRDGSLKAFAFNRATRIYSVMIPALILTLVFDRIGHSIRAEAYPPYNYWDISAAQHFWRGLTMSQTWVGAAEYIRTGTNDSLWSLSYEVAYYFLFGAAIFLTGALRVVILLLVTLVVGLPALLLMPAWAMGVLVWHRIKSGACLHRPLAWTFAIGGLAMIVLIKCLNVDDALIVLGRRGMVALGYIPEFRHSDAYLWFTLLSVFIGLHLIGAASLLRSTQINEAHPLPRFIRWVAGASFSLYVIHDPTLHLLDAIFPESLPYYDLWMLGLTLLTCFTFAALFERPLKPFREKILSLTQRQAPSRIPAE